MVNGQSEGYSGSGLPVYQSLYRQQYKFNEIGNMMTKESASQYTTVQPPGDNLNYRLDYEYLPGTHKASRIGDMYYAYDGNGNLVTEQYGSPVTTSGGSGQVREADGVYSVEYGFALTNRSAQESGSETAYRRDYTWNERNLLKRSSDGQYRVEYRYGSDGQRALKYSVSGNRHQETLYYNKMYQITPVSTQEIESKHIYVGEVRIVTKQKEAGNENYGQEYEKQYYYHGDHLGSAQLVTDWEGKIYEHIEYTPYGELWVDHSVSAVGSNPTAFRFTGKEMDSETGLYYYGARYLDPKTSRWLSTDPAMYDGSYIPGAPVSDEARKRNGNLPGMGGVFNTVNMHVYHYAGNNPIVYVDPDGEEDVYVLYGFTTSLKNVNSPRSLKGAIGDMLSKFAERWSMCENIRKMEASGLTVKVIENATSGDIKAAFGDSDAMMIYFSSHGTFPDADAGIRGSDGIWVSPGDIRNSGNLSTVIFQACNQGNASHISEWQGALGLYVNFVSWEGATDYKDANRFNLNEGWGNFNYYMNEILMIKNSQMFIDEHG